MGLRDWFRKDLPRGADAGGDAAGSPAARPLEIIERAVASSRRQSDDAWVTLEAVGPDHRARIVEVSGEHLNTCLEEVDLPGLLRSAGLSLLADSAVPGKTGLWALPGSSPGELAAAADLVFREHFGLNDGYPLKAIVQS